MHVGEPSCGFVNRNSARTSAHFCLFLTAEPGSEWTGLNAQSNPFMARAIELSIENVRSGRGGPFAAVVVKDGEIHRGGREPGDRPRMIRPPTPKSSPFAKLAKNWRRFELKDCELYTSCEPCPMCLGAIYWARPARVYFGNTAEDAAKVGFDDSLIYHEAARPHSQRQIPMIPLMREQALEAFRAWQEKSDKNPLLGPPAMDTRFIGKSVQRKEGPRKGHRSCAATSTT